MRTLQATNRPANVGFCCIRAGPSSERDNGVSTHRITANGLRLPVRMQCRSVSERGNMESAPMGSLQILCFLAEGLFFGFSR